jgi:hypothetical protein
MGFAPKPMCAKVEVVFPFCFNSALPPHQKFESNPACGLSGFAGGPELIFPPSGKRAPPHIPHIETAPPAFAKQREAKT